MINAIWWLLMQLWAPIEMLMIFSAPPDDPEVGESPNRTTERPQKPNNPNAEEAIKALCTLGFSKTIAKERVSRIISERPELGVEDIISFALRG